MSPLIADRLSLVSLCETSPTATVPDLETCPPADPNPPPAETPTPDQGETFSSDAVDREPVLKWVALASAVLLMTPAVRDMLPVTFISRPPEPA
ncbi:MAG: hypothetical protein ABF491_13150 [Acetobacter sp.]|uniref:hypothetical protein n=1 Tax=Acetobacter sp. TaxID=440 RepID=UPI0039EC8758